MVYVSRDSKILSLEKGCVLDFLWLKVNHELLCNCVSRCDLVKAFILIKEKLSIGDA